MRMKLAWAKPVALATAIAAFSLFYSCKKDPYEIWLMKQKPKVEDTTAFRKIKFLEIGERKMLTPDTIAKQAGDTTPRIPLKPRPIVSAPESE